MIGPRRPENDIIFVGVYRDEFAAQPVAAGRLAFSNTSDRAWFEYNPTFLAGGFALDPANLPLKPGPQVLPSGSHPGVFGDGAPDYWGQTVIRRILGKSSRLEPAERLTYAGEDHIGALVFRSRALPPLASQPASTALLEKYARFIASFDDGSIPMTDETMKAVALAGSSAGGARPKCTFREADGEYWLAKFSRTQNPVSLPAVEHAATVLAGQCGIATATTRLYESSTGDKVILVKRFDRTREGGRRMFMSAQTLLNAVEMTAGSYGDIAEAIRKVSATPGQDAPELFQRMVFNAATGNTDDHLKNHGLLRTAGQWRLSPAYDLTPQVMGDQLHSIGLGDRGGDPALENLLSEHHRFLLSLAEAKTIVGDMLARIGQWQAVFREAGVPPNDIEIIHEYECFSRVAPGIDEALAEPGADRGPDADRASLQNYLDGEGAPLSRERLQRLIASAETIGPWSNAEGVVMATWPGLSSSEASTRETQLLWPEAQEALIAEWQRREPDRAAEWQRDQGIDLGTGLGD